MVLFLVCLGCAFCVETKRLFVFLGEVLGLFWGLGDLGFGKTTTKKQQKTTKTKEIFGRRGLLRRKETVVFF